MDGSACDLCDRIERDERGENQFAVARTSTGYINLADVQYYEGYTCFVAKRCVNELHELPDHERDHYLHEMAIVAQAIFEAFQPRKMNYELLGNGAPHLHWHLFPRHADDPRPKGPVWEDQEFLRLMHAGAQADPERVDVSKARLLTALERSELTIEKRF